MLRKLFSLALISILLTVFVAIFDAQEPAKAQNGNVLEYNIWVEGDISNSDYTDEWILNGTAGDIVLIEMYEEPGEYGLSPEVQLLDPAGSELATNSYFLFAGGVIVYELAFDGEYTVLATRYDGSDGSSEGNYMLRASIVELVQPGERLEAIVHSDYEDELPDVFVLSFEEDVSLALYYKREPGDLYGRIQLQSWEATWWESDSIFDLDDIGGTYRGVIYIELEADTLYILSVEESLGSYSTDVDSAMTTITIDYAD